MPAWTTSGLMVSRSSARRARAYMGSQATARAASAPARVVARQGAQELARLVRQLGRGEVEEAGHHRASPASDPGTARRSMTAAASTAALSSRGIEPWPHVPLIAMR